MSYGSAVIPVAVLLSVILRTINPTEFDEWMRQDGGEGSEG